MSTLRLRTSTPLLKLYDKNDTTYSVLALKAFEIKSVSVKMLLFLLLCIAAQVLKIHSAKILAVVPTPSHSHQTHFQPLWRELASRGHHVTVLTTDPQRNASLTNLKEIDLSFTYEVFRKHSFSEVVTNLAEGNGSKIKIGERLADILIEMQRAQFSSPHVQELIHDKNIQFDLVMVEVFNPGMLSIAWRFQCPFIAILSYDCSVDFHTALGNPTHPVLNPDIYFNSVDPDDLTFLERIFSFILVLYNKFSTNNLLYPFLHEEARQFFGDELPPLADIRDNMSMMFINTNPLFHKLRPLNLNTVPIGGMIHLEQPKPLPQVLKQFLDGAENGAIYFSLSTILTFDNMSTKFRKALLGAIARIPYKIVMEIEGELKEYPKNLLVGRGVPQQDVLRHPNVKVFITQGSLISLKEALYNDMPIIGIPFVGDQHSNVKRVVKMGYGIEINWKEMSEEILVSAIDETMNNPRYRETAKELGAIFRDEEVSSLQRAVYWTEYVIRHKGARHLRNPALNMATWKLYMLDVIGFFVLLNILAYFMISICLCRKLVKSHKKSEIDKKKKK